jgi:hypothetical protein
MTIVPDIKDWTWVLDRPCPECGFDTRTVTRPALPPMLRQNAATWHEILSEPGTSARPSADRWSALEYGCHVRDVFRKFDERLQMMLALDDPTFPNWDQDATAVADRYAEQSPGEVAGQLVAAADVLAQRFSEVEPGQWERPGVRSDGAHFTVETLGRYLMHDPVHHLYDVGATGTDWPRRPTSPTAKT